MKQLLIYFELNTFEYFVWMEIQYVDTAKNSDNWSQKFLIFYGTQSAHTACYGRDISNDIKISGGPPARVHFATWFVEMKSTSQFRRDDFIATGLCSFTIRKDYSNCKQFMLTIDFQYKLTENSSNYLKLFFSLLNQILHLRNILFRNQQWSSRWY